MNKTIKLFYTNADCLLNKVDELKFKIKMCMDVVDFIAITEVNAKHI